MRRPNRRPNYSEIEDITNWEETAKYVIVLDGSTYKAYNGDTGEIDSQSTVASTVIQHAIDTGGAGEVALKTDVTLTAGLTGLAYVRLNLNGHTITPSASFNVITMKPDFGISNGKFDLTGLTFNDACIYFDGADHFNMGDVTATYQNTIVDRLLIQSASLKGKGVYMWADRQNVPNQEFINFVRVENCTFVDLEYGIKMFTNGTVGLAYINGNTFANNNFVENEFDIHLDRTNNDAWCQVGGNTFSNCQIQTDSAVTDTAVHINGSDNWFIGHIYDIGAPTNGIVIDAEAKQAHIVVNQPVTAITNNGTDTSILSTSDSALYAAGFNPISTDISVNNPANGANPFLVINGYDTGSSSNKQLKMRVQASGWAKIDCDESLQIAPTDRTHFSGGAAPQVKIEDVLMINPAAAPGSPVEGWIYANSTDHHIYYYNGTAWVQMDN